MLESASGSRRGVRHSSPARSFSERRVKGGDEVTGSLTKFHGGHFYVGVRVLHGYLVTHRLGVKQLRDLAGRSWQKPARDPPQEAVEGIDRRITRLTNALIVGKLDHRITHPTTNVQPRFSKLAN